MEGQHLGWNLFTLSYIGTIVFTLTQSWGFWRQYKAIESGKSVSVILFLYTAFIFVATFIYGLKIDKDVLAFNGFALLLMQGPILMRLYETKGFKKSEKIFSIVLTLITVAMIFSPAKDLFFFAASFGAIAMLLCQPWAILRNRDSGDVEIRMILMCLGSTVFWSYYAFKIHEWTLQIVCPSYMTIWLVTLVLWCKYKKPRLNPRSKKV